MTLYKDIPQPNDNRNQSQSDLLDNNRYVLNVSNPASITGILPVDHLATGNNGASPSDGFHKQVSFTNKGSLVNTMTNAVNGQSSANIIYSNMDGGAAGFSRSKLLSTTGDNATIVHNYIGDLIAAALFTIGPGPGFAITPSVGSNWQNCTVTRVSAGLYTITFSYTLPFTSYNVIISPEFKFPPNTYFISAYSNKTTTSVQISTVNASTLAQLDPPEVSVQIYGYW